MQSCLGVSSAKLVGLEFRTWSLKLNVFVLGLRTRGRCASKVDIKVVDITLTESCGRKTTSKKKRQVQHLPRIQQAR